MNIQTPAHLRDTTQDTPAHAADASFLQLQDLRVAFDGTPAVHGISLSVAMSERPSRFMPPCRRT